MTSRRSPHIRRHTPQLQPNMDARRRLDIRWRRTAHRGLAPYADAGILREYCQPHDPICAPHTNDTKMSFHLDYFDKWGDEAAAWVVGKVRQDDEASSGVKRIAHPVGGVFILLFMVGLI
jgi:hypothetical protein